MELDGAQPVSQVALFLALLESLGEWLGLRLTDAGRQAFLQADGLPGSGGSS